MKTVEAVNPTEYIHYLVLRMGRLVMVRGRALKTIPTC